MGRWHLHAARKLGAQVVGVVDRDMEAAQRLARRAPGATVTSDIATLLRRAHVDAAHVCTPPASHLPLGLELAAAGVHALIEKPLADTADDTRRLLAAAARSGVLVCPVHQYAWQAGVTRVVGMLPRLGPIKQLDFTICSAGGASMASGALDDILGDILPHPLSLIQRLMPAAELDRIEWTVLHPAPGEALIVAQHGSTLLSMLVSMASRPTCFTVSLRCGQASAVIDGFHGYAVVQSGTVSRTAKISRPFSAALQGFGAALANLATRAVRQELAYPGLRETVGRFHAAVRQRDSSLLPVSGELAIALAAARDRILAQLRPRVVRARVENG